MTPTNDPHTDTGEARPATCCGVCPPIGGGGYDCTCEGNPRCPSVMPRVGDQITTTEQLEALPEDSIVMDRDRDPWQRGEDGWPWPHLAEPVRTLAPFTVLYVPGEQPRPSVTDNARAGKCPDHKPVQHRDGKPPWCNRCGLTDAGTTPLEPAWAAGRAETTTEAVVKVLNEHPDMTDRSAIDGCGCGDSGGNEHVARELDRRGLLATAHTHPTRDQIELAVGSVLFNSMNYPNPVAVLGRDVGPLRNKVVDAVMNVLGGGGK